MRITTIQQLLFGFILTAIITAPISAATFVEISDDFSSTGALTGTSTDAGSATWSNISGTSGSITTGSGVASLSTSTSESTQVKFTSGTGDLSSGTFYFGFTLNVSVQSISTATTIQSIAGFRTGTAGGGSFALGFGTIRPSGAAATALGIPTAGLSQVSAGIFSTSSSSTTIAGWATPLTEGTNYRIVIGLDLDSDVATLWINPISTSSTSVTLSGITADVRGVFLRQGNASTGNSTLDDLVVSQTFATASAVPEPATYALFGGLAVLGLAAFRRRHTNRLPSAP
jgi:PEP-CTERM motif